jgi:hypothetical protein
MHCLNTRTAQNITVRGTHTVRRCHYVCVPRVVLRHQMSRAALRQLRASILVRAVEAAKTQQVAQA